NTVLELNVDGKEKLPALVHDVQYNPVTDAIDHVDFINVRMDQVVHAKIPLKFFGISPAVKELGGILTHTLTEVSVKCLPKDLIPFIEVSVESVVDFHSYVRIKDLKVSSAVTILHDPGDVVVTAVAPKIEEEAPIVAPGAEGAAAAVPGAEGAVAPGAEGAAPAAAAPEAKKADVKK
ncbi:MAG: 50S ribosomal protein L25, partial [Patescibacteria group bacterium]